MECDKGEEFPGQGIQSDEECPVWVVMESCKWPDEGRVCNQRSGGSMREWSYFAIFRVGENIQEGYCEIFIYLILVLRSCILP